MNETDVPALMFKGSHKMFKLKSFAMCGLQEPDRIAPNAQWEDTPPHLHGLIQRTLLAADLNTSAKLL